MIAVPYLTFTGVALYFYRLVKKHRRTLDATATSCDSSVNKVGAKES